jgi:chromosome segregation ATPase
MQDQLHQQVKRISDKLQLLLKQHQQLQKQYAILQDEHRQLKEEVNNKNIVVDDLQQKVAVLKTATNNLTEADKKELEKRLNHYIKEIDRCINLLGEK